MTEQTTRPQSKADLLARLDQARADLQSTVTRYSPEQLTGPADDGGWTAKDHLAHLTAWERSMVYLLRGQPRHAGLGVPEALYLSEDFDAINAVIHEQVRDEPLETVLANLTAAHEELLGLVRAMSEDDLRQPYSHFLPNEPGNDSGAPITRWISANADEHFDEHREYIERIVTTGK